VFHQYTVRLTRHDRDVVQQRLAEAGISTMVYYPVPQHRLPVYDGSYPSFEASERLACQALSLPVGPMLAQADIERVARHLISA